MSIKFPREQREQRAELTKRALAEVVRARLFERRFQQTTVASHSGISRSHLRALLRAEKQMSFFIFLELSEALRFDDAFQFLRRILDCRDQHLRDDGGENEPTAPMSNLHEQIDTYIRHLPELLQNQGKFVLIRGGAEIAGIYDSYQDALTAGYQRFKLASFLVKQIFAVERVNIRSRMLRERFQEHRSSSASFTRSMRLQHRHSRIGTPTRSTRQHLRHRRLRGKCPDS